MHPGFSSDASTEEYDVAASSGIGHASPPPMFNRRFPSSSPGHLGHARLPLPQPIQRSARATSTAEAGNPVRVVGIARQSPQKGGGGAHSALGAKIIDFFGASGGARAGAGARAGGARAGAGNGNGAGAGAGVGAGAQRPQKFKHVSGFGLVPVGNSPGSVRSVQSNGTEGSVDSRQGPAVYG